MAQTKWTTDHETIRQWAEERGAVPSAVKGTGSGDDPGIIRLDFPGYSGEGSLEPIEWDEWFEKLDENDLALLYQEETAEGEPSNFNKLVKRETVEERGKGKRAA
ncbi:1,4-alpha-glucan branching enzyme [Minicystis rosea]|nr:1,4-alpha-glucan branching enzyme [Minicystis rosea]